MSLPLYVHTLNALFTKQDNALIDIVLVHTELHTLVFLHVCVHTANCPGYPNDTMAVSVTAETVRPAARPCQWVPYLIDWVHALNPDEHTHLSRLKVGQLS